MSGKSPLDFSFKFSGLSLETLAGSSGLDVRGKLSGTLRLAGKNADLAMTLSANIPALTASGITAENLTAEISGNISKLSGTLKSPSVSANGLKLSDVNIPLTFSGNSLASKGGTAKFYGGTLNNSLTFGTGTMKFTDEISADGLDINSLIQDMAGPLEGKISGAGKLTFKIAGSAKDKLTYSGTGNFSMGEGKITGFKWLDLFTRIHKSDGLRFANVNAPMMLQTGKLTVRAGAISQFFISLACILATNPKNINTANIIINSLLFLIKSLLYLHTLLNEHLHHLYLNEVQKMPHHLLLNVH